VPADRSKQLKDELDQLKENAEYRAFRPVLEHIERLVNAQAHDPQALETLRETAAELIAIVKAGNAARRKGQDPSEFLDETIRGQGYYQDKWEVKGDVTQAGRDIVHNRISIVLSDAVRELKPPDSMQIPIVLVAMTSTEAKALAAETAFEGHLPALLEEFKRLNSHLREIGHGEWANHYGAESKDWRPTGGAKSIVDLVDEALKSMNKYSPLPKPLMAKFYDVRMLVPGDQSRRMLLSTLRRKGCVVIIDALSMRHPTLLQAFQRTLLDVYPTTSVLSLAPHSAAFDLVRDMIYGLQMNLKDSEWNQRRLDFTEDYACHELSKLDEFPKWLLSRAKEIYRGAAAGGSMIDQIKNG
jgi:hypothetical protein